MGKIVLNYWSQWSRRKNSNKFMTGTDVPCEMNLNPLPCLPSTAAVGLYEKGFHIVSNTMTSQLTISYFLLSFPSR